MEDLSTKCDHQLVSLPLLSGCKKKPRFELLLGADSKTNAWLVQPAKNIRKRQFQK
jgi:hypothetical protein